MTSTDAAANSRSSDESGPRQWDRIRKRPKDYRTLVICIAFDFAACQQPMFPSGHHDERTISLLVVSAFGRSSSTSCPSTI